MAPSLVLLYDRQIGGRTWSRINKYQKTQSLTIPSSQAKLVAFLLFLQTLDGLRSDA